MRRWYMTEDWFSPEAPYFALELHNAVVSANIPFVIDIMRQQSDKFVLLAGTNGPET